MINKTKLAGDMGAFLKPFISIVIPVCFCLVMAIPLEAETAASFFSGSSAYAFSAKTSVGVLAGQGIEIVYATPDDDIVMSRLDWDMKPLLYIGQSFSFSPRKPYEKWGGFGDVSVKFGIPGKTGAMEDRDWLAENYVFSNFSSHDNYTRGALLLDVSGGVSFPFARLFLAKAFLNFSYMHFSWAARDGYMQYAPKSSPEYYAEWDPSLVKRPVYGPAIDYSQDWTIFSVGTSCEAALGKFFRTELAFSFGPLVYAKAQDDHQWERNKVQFNDTLSGGFLLEPGGSFTFIPHERFALSLYAKYRLITNMRGDTKSRSTGYMADGTWLKDKGMAGAEFWAIDGGISLKITL